MTSKENEYLKDFNNDTSEDELAEFGEAVERWVEL